MPNSTTPENLNPVDVAIAEYFDAVDAGETLTDEEFISRHADLQEELREFFAAASEIESLAGPTLLEYSRISSSADTSAILDTLSPPSPRPNRRRPELAPGSEFGRYRIIDEIGRGAMGSVYRAFDNQLARDVALKIPVFGEQQEPEMIERFYREARVAATIRNPHICPVFDIDQLNGIHYITMAFIEGETLSHYIAAGKDLTPRRVATIVLKIAQSLQKMHDNGVLHRDLKPGNIMIDRDGEPVVMDFGLARAGGQGDVRSTQAGSIIGSPAYMSPEQILGEDRLIGPASDVYSLGIIMHEMLTGELPYRGSVISVFSQVVSNEPTPHAALANSGDMRLAGICARMMAKQLDQRFSSMAEVVRALEDYLQDQPPVMATLVEKPAKSAKATSTETRIALILVASLLLVLLLVGATAAVGYVAFVKPKRVETVQKTRPKPPPPAAVADDPADVKGDVAPPNPQTVSLRYNWPTESPFGYSIRIEAAREDLKETLEGTLFYEVAGTEKGNTRIRFDSRLSASSDSKTPTSAFTYERVSDSFPTFREIVSRFPKHEFVINRYGDVVENGCQTQLPFALGCIGQFPLEAFGEQPIGGGRRTDEFNVDVFRTAPPLRISPLHTPPEMASLKLQGQTGIHVQDSTGKDVLLDTTYQIDAPDKGRYSATGTGQISFDKRRGLITRKTISLVVVDQGQTVEVTAECCLLDDNELAERRRKLDPEADPVTDEHRAQMEALTPPIEIPSELAVTAGSVIKEGDVLQAPRSGNWQDVKVLAVLPDGRVQIHWVGFGSEYDEVVTRSRLRRPPTDE